MAMKEKIPFGEVESQTLEFKSAAALEQPEKIAREVVAMLNAEGGEVWIGLRDDQGRAVEIEPIKGADSVKRRLWDFLVDTLDPIPRSEEVRVDLVALPSGEVGDGKLLLIEIKPTKDRFPYAYVRGAAWHFPTRVDARVRPLSREEIFKSNANATERELELSRARDRLQTWRDGDRQNGFAGLWLGLATAPRLSLDVSDQLFVELARDPQASLNRRSGITFVDPFHQPRVGLECITWGDIYGTDQISTWTEMPQFELRAEIREDGCARFFASFGALTGGGQYIWPIALLELPISALRIMSRVYSARALQNFELVAELALIGRADQGLAPTRETLKFQNVRNASGDQDIIFQSPLKFTRKEIVEEPDRCGYRLIQRIYQAFGLREESIPAEFERESGRLILAE